MKTDYEDIVGPETRDMIRAMRAAGSFAPACSPPPYELACRMLNAIGWNGNDFRLRDPVALAITPEVERINRRANDRHQFRSEAT